MRLLILGSGSSVPHPRRSSSAYWLDCENGSMLLDCSASAIHRMAQEGCDWANLDAIWISHFHLDHCGGLAPLLFGTKHAPDTQKRTKPMRIFGPAGLDELVRSFDEAGPYGLLSQPFPLELAEIAPGEPFTIFEGVTATAHSTPHTRESCAIRITDTAGGGSLVYTSDTGVSDDLAEFALGADVLLAECSFVKDKPVEKHLEIADVVDLARLSKPGRVVLTHFYPEWDEVDLPAAVAEVAEICDVIEAADGLRLTVGGRGRK